MYIRLDTQHIDNNLAQDPKMQAIAGIISSFIQHYITHLLANFYATIYGTIYAATIYRLRRRYEHECVPE
jgi:hypothetical protein